MLGTSSKMGCVSTPRIPAPERPPMPHDDAPPKRPSAERAQMWMRWLNALMEERGLRNTDLVALINRPTIGSGTVGNWRDGTYAPSELFAWIVADALALPAPDVLRAAGFDEMADKAAHIAAHGAQPPPQDPVLEMLDALGKPELTAQLKLDYQRDMFAAKRRAELEVAELKRRIPQDEPDGDSDTDTAAR